MSEDRGRTSERYREIEKIMGNKKKKRLKREGKGNK